MVDVTRAKLLHEVLTSFFAEAVHDAPELFSGVDFGNARSTGFSTGLDQAGVFDCIGELGQFNIVEQGRELRYRNALVSCLNTHSELIAKIAGRRLSHTGDAELFAEIGGFFHIKIIHGDDAVDLAALH